jgi:Microsomal signal peptidase 12 kDa subunit (SPC12)
VSEFAQVVGLVWGYIIQQFSQTVYILGAGFVLACLVSFFSSFCERTKVNSGRISIKSGFNPQVTVPPWPMYRRKPLNWQKAVSSVDSAAAAQSKSKKKK